MFTIREAASEPFNNRSTFSSKPFLKIDKVKQFQRNIYRCINIGFDMGRDARDLWNYCTCYCGFIVVLFHVPYVCSYKPLLVPECQSL